MKTQIEYAREGVMTREMEAVSRDEGLNADDVRMRVAAGEIIILNSRTRKNQRIAGIGKGLRTKINASIGTSTDIADMGLEVEKARVAEACGADTLMDLSVGGDIKKIRREVLQAINLPVGTVPLYQAFAQSI